MVTSGCSGIRQARERVFGSEATNVLTTVSQRPVEMPESGQPAASLALRRGPLLAVYAAQDRNTADLYLTDLPMERLSAEDDTLAGLSGTIVHVSIFLVPTAGRTPIDVTAVNASIRQVVIADGVVGVYSGGGFVDVEEIEAEGLEGQIRRATIRLTRQSNGFADALGPSELSGNFNAKLDVARSRVLSARLAAMLKQTQPVASDAVTKP
jgi:hypothetical protein